MALSLPDHDHFPHHAVVGGETNGNAFIDRVYAKLSPIYDLVFGAALQAGRVAAIQRMDIRPGDRVLEVGAGTGINAPLYPRSCDVTAIDLSSSMLERAHARVRREGLTHVRLLEADAAQLTFADESFDSIYAPYMVSVVPDPVRVVREMRRVCRRGGKIVILNHFRSAHPLISRIEHAISPLTAHIGFRSDVDLDDIVARSGLQVSSVEKVNFPPIWSLVTCVK